jgi:hypothetical protein
MDQDIEIDVSDHVEEVNSLRVRMTAERQQQLLLSEARETLRNHAILSSNKAERVKYGKPRIPIEALRKTFGHSFLHEAGAPARGRVLRCAYLSMFPAGASMRYIQSFQK